MGWTSQHASHYKGTIVDRKKECDSYFEGINEEHYKVLKSSMVGSVYYAAVKKLTEAKKDENGQYTYTPVENGNIFGVVILTSTDMKDYFNFSFKLIEEQLGPGYYDCPVGILDLLSETNDEISLAWRKKCREKHERKKILKNLKVGAEIIVKNVFPKEDICFVKEIVQGKEYWIKKGSFSFIKPEQILQRGFETIKE